jgi:hypothetical protein
MWNEIELYWQYQFLDYLFCSNTDYHIRIVCNTINLIDWIVFQIIKRQLIKFDIDFCIEMFKIAYKKFTIFKTMIFNISTFNSSLLTEQLMKHFPITYIALRYLSIIKEHIHYLFEKSLEAKQTFPYVIFVMHLLSISPCF